MEIFVSKVFVHKIFVLKILIIYEDLTLFVVVCDRENFLTMKISQFAVNSPELSESSKFFMAQKFNETSIC